MHRNIVNSNVLSLFTNRMLIGGTKYEKINYFGCHGLSHCGLWRMYGNRYNLYSMQTGLLFGKQKLCCMSRRRDQRGPKQIRYQRLLYPIRHIRIRRHGHLYIQRKLQLHQLKCGNCARQINTHVIATARKCCGNDMCKSAWFIDYLDCFTAFAMTKVFMSVLPCHCEEPGASATDDVAIQPSLQCKDAPCLLLNCVNIHCIIRVHWPITNVGCRYLFNCQ